MSSDSGLLIVGGAPVESDGLRDALIRSAESVIAVDAGAGYCLAAGRMPEIAIGDFDSLAEGLLGQLQAGGCSIVHLEPEKDVTDLEAALDLCVRTQRERPVLTAVLGGRSDHELAVWGAMARRAHLAPEVREPDLSAWVIRGGGFGESLALAGAGATVSVLALLSDASVSLEGMRYPLSGDVLVPLSGRGVSNVIDAHLGRIMVHEGVVAVISCRTDSDPAIRVPDSGVG